MVESGANREMDVLAMAAAAGIGVPLDTDRLSATLRAGVEWPTLQGLAVAHRCSPLLHRLFSLVPCAAVPGPLREAVRRTYLASVARSATMGMTLAGARDLLDARGISLRVLKGPAMAALAYVDPSLREYEDLDLLVPRESFVEARRAFESVGFASRWPMSDGEVVAHMRAGWDSHLRCARTGVLVELTTGVCPAYFLNPPQRDLWARPMAFRVDEQSFQTVSAVALPALLCVHGSKHAWDRLIWIADLAGLISRGHVPDWSAVVEVARGWGALRMLVVGVALAGRLLAGEPPPECRRLLDRDPEGVRIASRLWQRLTSGNQRRSSGAAKIRFHLRCRERLRDRARYLALLALTPSHGDWRAVRLPDSLLALHYVLRPFRLARKALRSRRR